MAKHKSPGQPVATTPVAASQPVENTITDPQLSQTSGKVANGDISATNAASPIPSELPRTDAALAAPVTPSNSATVHNSFRIQRANPDREPDPPRARPAFNAPRVQLPSAPAHLETPVTTESNTAPSDTNANAEILSELPQAAATELPAVPVSRSPVDKFREFLEMKNLKVTSERIGLVEFIFSHHEHFEADQLVSELKKAKLAGSRPTVYRTLNLLVEAGLLRELHFGKRKAYEHNYGYPHHDHLQCERCERIFEFINEDIDHILEQICRQSRFRPTNRRLIIQGICEECSLKASSKRRKLDNI